MQAMLMSKQVKHVNSGPEICITVNHVNLTSFHYTYIYYSVGAGYKEVTLENQGNNGLLHGNVKSFVH